MPIYEHMPKAEAVPTMNKSHCGNRPDFGA
jgi:hypothetical protein